MSTNSQWFIRGRLKTRQLLLLVALADEGNIHRAAELLNMTQPAASKLLKDLEDVLAVRLFERMPRGMRPTWYGESLIRHARMVINSLEQAHGEIEALKEGRFGQVRVGSIMTPGLTVMPAAIAQAKGEHSSLRISLEIETSPVLLERLSQGQLDMAVARLGAEHDQQLFRYERLSEEPICAMVRGGHALLRRQQLSLEDVADVGWITPPAGSVLRHRFDLMFQEASLAPPTNIVETAALLFITKMLQQSDMVALVPVEVARYYAAHGMVALLPLTLPCRMDAFGIITRRDQLLSPGAKVMMRALKSACLGAYGEAGHLDWREDA